MLQFMTTIPVKMRLNVTDEDFGKGLIFAPLIGLLIGGILAASYYCLNLLFPIYITAILIIIIYIILTGGIHLDGLGDTFDGLFSNRSKERMLEIMRDSRVGTNGVLAIASIFLLNIALITAINPSNIIYAIILFPVGGRVGSIVGAGASKYARSGEGLGKSFIDHCGVKEILIGLVISGCIFFGVAGIKGLLLLFIVAISSYILIKFFSRKIGGSTGDILGAVCEINQTIFLIAAFVLFR